MLIEEHLKKKGFWYEPIFYELVDHIRIAISFKMKQGMPFIDAFESTKEEFGQGGLERIYLQTINSLTPMTRLRSYFKSALRNILKQRVYSIVNLLGLVLGIAVSTTIAIYINDELSFDKFHPNNVYRVSAHVIANGQKYDEAKAQFPLAEALRSDVAAVEAAFRMHRPYETPLLKYKEVKHAESELFYVGDTFFDVFGYQLLEGDPKSVLQNPNSIILTRKAAIKYFGNEDPVGKNIDIVLGDEVRSLQVTGIVQNENERSHFKFEVLVPINFLLNYWRQQYGEGGPEDSWFWTGTWTYVRLKPGTEQNFAGQLPGIVSKYFPPAWKNESLLSMDAIEDIHLRSNRVAELEPNGSISQVKIFGSIGFVVLFIAVLNFINLMSAQGFNYAKQVGVRKFLGAVRKDILQLYLIESVLLSLTAGLGALFLIELLLLPGVDQLTGKSLSITQYLQPLYIVLYLFTLVTIGVIAGIFPSLTLSRLQSLKILKGTYSAGRSGSFTRQIFVVLQFVASVVLIISVIVINMQNEHIRSFDTGFNKENILVVRGSGGVNERSEAFKNEVLKVPGVLAISGVLDLPGRGAPSLRFIPEGKPDDQPEQVPLSYTDYDLLNVTGMEMAAGRFFDRSQLNDPEEGFVLNEEAARLFGWENTEAVGKTIKMFAPGSSEIGGQGKVIGVLKNYNFESVHHPIRPLVTVMHSNLDYYLVKFEGSDLESLTDGIEKAWNEFDPSWPMESFLLDENLAQIYEREKKLSWITNYGMGFALVIALIGIYGLSSYLLSRRTKEVGIRRLLGSKQSNLMFILSRNFMFLILIANIIAWPLAYFAMNQWLQSFVYRIDLQWFAFLGATAVTLVLAFLAIGYHVFKISKTDPITSLRYE